MNNLDALIVLFVYNRPWHTLQTIEALQKNEFADQSDMIVYSDGAKNQNDQKDVDSVRQYIKTIKGFKSVKIIERDKNWGLAGSIIAGVTEVVNKYGKVIVLEDDIVTSPYFLTYMNEALYYYKNEKKIFSISGYNHPEHIMPIPDDYKEKMYFNYRNSSWGWGTWGDRWAKADWNMSDYKSFRENNKLKMRFNRGGEDLSDMLAEQMEGKISSWAIRWSYSHFLHNAYSVCPVFSYVNNIGHDGSGIHCEKTSRFYNDLTQSVNKIDFISNIDINEQVMDSFRNIYRYSLISKIKKIILKILLVK